MSMLLCPNCNKLKSLDRFGYDPKLGRIKHNVCTTCYSRKFEAKIRLEMFEIFGWKCTCCGEDHPQFLSLDHINNDGAEHRKEFGNSHILRDAKKQGWPKDRYQLLCMNCNSAKGFYGECPHKSGITKEQHYEDLKSKIFYTGNLHTGTTTEKMQLESFESKMLDLVKGGKLSIEEIETLIKGKES